MTRGLAAMLAAIFIVNTLVPAADAFAQAAAAFPEVPLPKPQVRPRRWAYATMLTGAALIGTSVALERRADRNYSRYLASTEPSEIGELYDRTRRDDNFSTMSLMGGEALVAVGLYLRFLQRPSSERLALELHPDRCALSFRF